MKHSLKQYSSWYRKSLIAIRKFAVTVFVLSIINVLMPGCKKDDNGPPPPPPDIKLGDHYGGGIVFFVDASKQHGLVAATADQSVTDPWFNGTFVATNATSTSDGAGNTQKIISAQGDGVYAAHLCKDYSGGGFHDWFLPSKDQLATLYSQKALVGGFVDDLYWSSTESAVAEAWVQDFTQGNQYTDNTSDGANVHSRAIRAF